MGFFRFLSGQVDCGVCVCALNCNSRPWKFQLYFNEIRELSSRIDVVFCH